MTTTDRRSLLASQISDHKITYANLELEAFKAWDSKNWEKLRTCADNLQYLDQTINAKHAEINRLNHITEREAIEVLT